MMTPHHKQSRFTRQWQLFAMLLPGLIALTLFVYVALYGWTMAFWKYKPGQGYTSGIFMGLTYFKQFLVDMSDAGYVLKNTLLINFGSILINLTASLFLALVINEIRGRRVKKLVQTITFLPYFVSWVISYTIFYSFLAVENGVINQVLVKLGFVRQGIDFMGNKRYAWQIIWATSLWKYIGYNSMIFLSSIVGIDQEMYEAAQIDGASRLGCIAYITIPNLSRTFVVLLILNSGTIFSSNFDQFYLFSNVGNLTSLEVFDMYIYRYGLKLFNFSYATAVGITKTFASLLVLIIVNTISKRFSDITLF
jgi:putative aldouronate transport system permease protein